jgi:hypothetical protein
MDGSCGRLPITTTSTIRNPIVAVRVTHHTHALTSIC